MALRFQVRSTQLDAYYSLSGGAHAPIYRNGTTTPPALVASALSGVHGGSLIDFSAAGGVRALSYPGQLNVGETPLTPAPITIRARFFPTGSGNPSVTEGLFQSDMGLMTNGTLSRIEVNVQTTGALIVTMVNADNDVIVSGVGSASLTPLIVADSPFEVQIAWDGQAGTGKIKVSVNGAPFETRNAAFAAKFNWPAMRHWLIGMSFGAGLTNRMRLNEFLVFDDEKSDTYAMASDFEAAEEYDPANNSVMDAGEVKIGVAFTRAGQAATGTYDGADRWDTVPTDRVDTGFQYLANGVTLTGDSDDPAEANVKLGVVYDNGTKTGTYDPINGPFTPPEVAPVYECDVYGYLADALGEPPAVGTAKLIVKNTVVFENGSHFIHPTTQEATFDAQGYVEISLAESATAGAKYQFKIQYQDESGKTVTKTLGWASVPRSLSADLSSLTFTPTA